MPLEPPPLYRTSPSSQPPASRPTRGRARPPSAASFSSSFLSSPPSFRGHRRPFPVGTGSHQADRLLPPPASPPRCYPSPVPSAFPVSSPVLPSASTSSIPPSSPPPPPGPYGDIEPTIVEEIHDHTEPQSACRVPFLMGFIDTFLNLCDGGRGEFPYSSQDLSYPTAPLHSHHRSHSASVRPRRYRTIRRTPPSRLALFPPRAQAYSSSSYLLAPSPPLVRSYSETDADVWTGSSSSPAFLYDYQTRDQFGAPVKSPASIARDMMMRSQTPYPHTVYTHHHGGSKSRYASVPPPPRASTYTIHETAAPYYYTSHGPPLVGTPEVVATNTYYYTPGGGGQKGGTGGGAYHHAASDSSGGVVLAPGRSPYTMTAAGTGEGYYGGTTVGGGGRRVYDGVVEHEEATAAALLRKETELQRRIEEKQVQLRLLQKQLDAAAAGTPSPTAGSPLSSSVRAGGRLGGGGEAEGEQEDVRKLRLDLCEKELELEELRTEMNLKRKEKAQQDVDDILKAGKNHSEKGGGAENNPSAGRCVSCSPSHDKNAKRREEALKHLVQQKEEENRLLSRRIEGLRDERRDMKELLIQKDRQLAAAIGSTDPDCKEASAVQLGVKAISMVQDNVELKERIRVLEADVLSLQDEKQRREALLDETFKKLNDKRTEAAGLLEMISQRDMKIARVETFLQQRNRDYEKLQERSRIALEAERERVLKSQEEIRILEEQQVALKNVISSRDEKVLCLQNEVVRRDAIIKQLEQRTKVLTKDLDQSTLHLQQMLRASAAKDAYLHELETHLRQNEVERQTSYLAEISRTRQMALETRLKEEECRNALNEKDEVLTSVKHELNRSSHTLQQIRQAFEGIEYTDQCYRPINISSSSSSPPTDPYIFLPPQHREISSSPSSPSQKALGVAGGGAGKRGGGGGGGGGADFHHSIGGGVSLPAASGGVDTPGLGGGRGGVGAGGEKRAISPSFLNDRSTSLPQRPLHESLQALHADFLLNSSHNEPLYSHPGSAADSSSLPVNHSTAALASSAASSSPLPPQPSGGAPAYAGVLRQSTTSSLTGGSGAAGGGGGARGGGRSYPAQGIGEGLKSQYASYPHQYHAYYIPVSGDEVDEAVADFFDRNPRYSSYSSNICRISPGQYYIFPGSKPVALHLHPSLGILAEKPGGKSNEWVPFSSLCDVYTRPAITESPLRPSSGGAGEVLKEGAKEEDDSFRGGEEQKKAKGP